MTPQPVSRGGAPPQGVTTRPTNSSAPPGYVSARIDAPVMRLDNVAVCDSMTGQGLGRRLVEWLESEARAQGLEVVEFSRDAGITIVEQVSGDPTPDDDTSGSVSVSTASSSVQVMDIAYLSANGELFLGDLSSASSFDAAPTQLDLETAWTYIGDASVPQE